MPNELYIRLASFLLILMMVALWENRQPHLSLRLAYRRWPLNFALVVINSMLLKWLIPAGAVGTALLCNTQQFGLLYQMELPTALQVVLAVLFLDFMIYVQHVVVHKVPLFWRLHQVHHADCDIDVSTA
ncbi:MAG: sterol desaturase family protein, partial [Mariprofundaceae bacterium]|nr:sterol desaturase family protein [Mariprofundaceae bacterium]